MFICLYIHLAINQAARMELNSPNRAAGLKRPEDATDALAHNFPMLELDEVVEVEDWSFLELGETGGIIFGG